jgi:hypothetical protein
MGRRLLVGAALLVALLAIPEAARAEQVAGCAVTGMTAESAADTVQLRESVATTPAQELVGVPLDRAVSWQVPGHTEPVLVVDTSDTRPGALAPSEPAGTVTMFGLTRQVDLGFTGAGEGRLVSSSGVPGLGAFTRTGRLALTGAGCDVAALIVVDRSPFTTVAGLGGLAAAVAFGVLMVVVARRPGGSWWRRFAAAGPLGLLAGASEAVLLHDAGTFDPASRLSWWLPVAGVAMAAALPWTRRPGWRAWRRRAGAGSLVPARVGRWQPETLFTRTERFEVWEASAGDGGAQAGGSGGGPDGGATRALVKVPAAGTGGEPGVRLMLAREAAVLSQVDHPNCTRLVEARVSDGPAAVILAPVDGATLRAVLAGTDRLSGPQAVTVMLGVLAGLGTVHQLGMVHRGVRPENIWLDVDGRVLLAGFELACPGLEHPIAPEGGSPYASPEQLRGEQLDPRSDLWSCGAVLAELLTGQAPEPDATGPSGVDDLPEPVATLLAEALAPAPAGRPGAAAALADRLRQVAREAYGPDWADRGALGAAVLAHAAIGAAVAGYAAGGAGASGAAAPIASGLGAAATAGLGSGAAPSSGLGAAAAAAPGGPAAQPVGAGAGAGASTGAGAGTGASAGGGAASGKLGGVVVPAATAAIAAVVGIAGLVAGAPPAEAAVEVITPEAAQVIFVRTVDEAREDDYRHLAGEAAERVSELWAHDDSLRAGDLVEIVVGVPPGQLGYPAWFLATAELRVGDTIVHLFSRFERVAAAEPWLATVLGWSVHPVVGPPELDENGWLVPLPDEPAQPGESAAELELVIDPADLPSRYADWYTRSVAAGEVLADDLLVLAPDLTDAYQGASLVLVSHLLNEVTNAAFFRPRASRWESVAVPEPAEPTMRLQDPTTAVVSFTVVAQTTRWARADNRFEPCRNSSASDAVDPRPHGQIGVDVHLVVEAAVPVRQPWRGESVTAPVSVVIDDNTSQAQWTYAPERSIPC